MAAPGEGYACVDDAARGIVLLSAALDAQDDPVSAQLELLTKFVLAMQNSNGYFNNFIQTDGRINTGYRTSVGGIELVVVARLVGAGGSVCSPAAPTPIWRGGCRHRLRGSSPT